MKIKAIIFDCFGVLVGKGYWQVYESLGGDVQKDAAFIDEWLDKVNIGGIDNNEFGRIMSAHLGISLKDYQKAFQEDEVPNTEVFDFIESSLASRFKLAIVSNATGDSVRRKVPAEKQALFDEIFASAEVGYLKPDPEFFRLALEKLGVSAEEAIFVDDHQKYIDGAKAVGLNTILFRSLDDLVVGVDQFARGS